MSLLLDALQRASLEKKRLAEARGTDIPADPPAPTTFPELSLEPVEEPPIPAESYPDSASESLPPAMEIPSDTGTAPTPDQASALDRTPLGLVPSVETSAPTNAGDGQFFEEVTSKRAAVESEPDTSRATAQATEDPALSTTPDNARLQSSNLLHEQTGAVASNTTSPSPEPSRAEPSPRIAREILAAHQLPKRKLTTKTIVLGSLAVIVALANAAFFLGYFDRMIGSGDSVVGTGVAVAPPPAQIPPVEKAAPDGQVADAGPTGAVVMAGTESASALAGPRAEEGTVSTSPPRPKTETSVGTTRERKSTASPSRPQPTVLVSRPASSNPLQSAYEALRAGRFEEAGVAYRQALKNNPAERDALLGLAHLAHRAGSFDEARDLYQQVLRLDPEQPDAVAGLLSIASTSDPANAASRMRDMAERSPQSPVAMSTLGSMLAREGRIGEAQQAFFQAYALDPENALHAYNLAVALDRLHKYAQAREYYHRALAIAEIGGSSRVAGFPSEQAKARLEQLREAAGDASEARPVASPAR